MIIKHYQEAKDIVEALYKKSKRSFYRKDRLYKQAYHFSPFYRDFILKIIKSNSLSIKHRYNSGAYTPTVQSTQETKLSKRAKGYIETDINDVDTLPHEIGHASDFWFGENKSLTSNVILSNGKTLKEIFNEEFACNFEDIYKGIMDEFKFIVNKNIQPDAYNILMDNLPVYKKLARTSNHSTRMRIHKYLYEKRFVEVYYQLYTKKWYSLLDEKYGPVVDAISSKKDLIELFLTCHTVDYYNVNDSRVVEEFYANLFAAKVTSEHVKFEELKRLLPESFAAFEELFYMFYDKIQNNKRFTDVVIKREVEEKQSEL